jgi:23S rRNA (cytidine1920-2'-O)/16S rRNA (cytidine1409-2'-O)-methyltransferase
MPAPASRPDHGPVHRRERLDQALVSRGLCPSREQAQRLILAGTVRLNGQLADKPGRRILSDDELQLLASQRYVSRGGNKLEHALKSFGVDVTGAVALDLGASTGGFTDCLLQHGAHRVYAIDVGRGQLAWKLRQDPRVVVMEGLNARHLASSHFPADAPPPSFAVIDCSFISLKKILPTAVELLAPSAMIVALVKPQFEAGRAEADRGEGVITDPKVHQRVLRELAEFVGGLIACRWLDVTESPLRGPAGNKEFLACIEKVS